MVLASSSACTPVDLQGDGGAGGASASIANAAARPVSDESFDEALVAAPALANLDAQVEKDLHAEDRLDLLAGAAADSLDDATPLAHHDGFLRLGLDDETGLDLDQGPVDTLRDARDLDRHGVRHLVAGTPQSLLADQLGEEQFERLVTLLALGKVDGPGRHGVGQPGQHVAQAVATLGRHGQNVAAAGEPARLLEARAQPRAVHKVDLVQGHEGRKRGAGDRYVVQAVAGAALPALVALNKIDLVDGPRLGARLEEARRLAGGRDVLPVSAKRGDGLGDVLARLADAMPPGPVYFPDGQKSDQPLELLVAELVREQALRRTRDEVPHAVAVEVTGITERVDRPLVEIEASLIVETESQKAIVVGKGGRVVKAIGSGARQEIEAILGVQVFLDLRVKVRKRWRRDERFIERLI